MGSWEDQVSTGGGGGVTDHGALTGLADDDHTQYLLVNATRAMAGILNMGTHKIQGVVDPTLAQDAATKAWCDANFGAGVTDHGDLTGLADDDHTQYLLVSGARAMSGNLGMGGYGLTNCHSLYADGTDSYADIGGGSAYPARVIAYAEGAGHPGEVRLYVPNAAKNDWVLGLVVSGVSDAPIVTIPHGLNMGSKNIASVADPAAAQDAATKNYCDTNFNNYTHPSARACSSGNWAWDAISGKPSTYYTHPSDRQCSSGLWNATSISGTLPVGHGGTGVTDDSYDADKVDGCDAGSSNGNVWKVPATGPGSIAAGNDSGFYGKGPGTDGYQLTCHGDWTALTWSASSDLVFSDTHCPKCHKKFEDGETLVLYIAGHNEIGDILTIPMHKECAEAPRKTVMIKRKVMEDQYVLDELTGRTRMQRVQKVQKKTVTKKRMKENVELDRKTGEFWQLGDGKRKKRITNTEAIESYGDTIDEVVYKDVEYEM